MSEKRFILPTQLLSKLSRGVPLTPEEQVTANDYVRARESQIQLREELPHLYGWKWYPWAREFYESTNKINLLCAANQISKSSTQIRKCITWATDRSLWRTLWGRDPVQFWYLYPTADVATAEFHTKWQQFLPKGAKKDDPIYGWDAEFEKKKLKAIHFKSGVHLFFKTYAQDTSTLQTGTCDAIFCDEELNTEHYDELIFRISASNGYFHMVFTATLGQEFWRLAMEPGDEETEALPGAYKRCVSLYECKLYEDGTPSHWTDERIQTTKNRCKNQNEVLRRVYGRFVYDGPGRKYEQFDIKRHMKPKHPLPKDWSVYAGIDVGSGGEKGHPAAICFVAVSPNYRQARVFLGWRGDGILTTAGDVLEKYNAMVLENNLDVTEAFYDWACKDFDTIQSRQGGTFQAADKSRERGEQIINVLFKNDLIFIYEDDELQKLATELIKLRSETAKTKAKDDFIDAFRYAVTRIPWDWTVIGPESSREHEPPPEVDESKLPAEERSRLALAREIDDRRKAFHDSNQQYADDIADEIQEWNELGGG